MIETTCRHRPVMYVWIDALTNYVNALGWTRDSEEYKRFWSEAGKRMHVMGKGVIRSHAVYWPAMLLSAGPPMPTDIIAHGYLTVDGHKISKSLGPRPPTSARRWRRRSCRRPCTTSSGPFGASAS
jgi:methionyl-tRNA synthetase